MLKFAIAVDDDGTVIAASRDAGEVLAAYKAWPGPGKAHLAERVHFDRSKRITADEVSQIPKRKKKHEAHE